MIESHIAVAVGTTLGIILGFWMGKSWYRGSLRL